MKTSMTKDKIICAISSHPDEDVVELWVFSPKTRNITIRKTDIPFVVHALSGIKHDEAHPVDYSL